MAAVLKLARKTKDYVKNKVFWEYITSMHFWGPVANWGFSLAAFKDLWASPETISGLMTTALIFYSLVFLRFAYRIQPPNWMLVACYAINIVTQSIQGTRYLLYHYGNVGMITPADSHGPSGTNST